MLIILRRLFPLDISFISSRQINIGTNSYDTILITDIQKKCAAYSGIIINFVDVLYFRITANRGIRMGIIVNMIMINTQPDILVAGEVRYSAENREIIFFRFPAPWNITQVKLVIVPQAEIISGHHAAHTEIMLPDVKIQIHSNDSL